LKYMSIIYYSGNSVAPLRGADVSNALIELLSTVKWGKLDYLMLDMPPGISDATLDLIRLVRRVEFLIVATPSRLAFETVKKLAGLLKELRIPIIGVVENMKMSGSDELARQTGTLGLAFLGEIAYDKAVEEALGRTDRLLSTPFGKRVKLLALRIRENAAS